MKLLKHSPLAPFVCLFMGKNKCFCIWVLMCMYTQFSTFISLFFFYLYVYTVALIQFFMAISFPSSLTALLRERFKSNVVIIFLFLTNPLLQTWSNMMMMKEGEKKQTECVLLTWEQNSPHIDSIGSKVLRVGLSDSHRPHCCLIFCWLSFDLLCCHSFQHSCHSPLSNVPSLSHLMVRPCLMFDAALVMKLK